MLFTTVNYLVFLPIVFIIYWLVREDKRWIILLLASYFFYANWNVYYVGLIFSVTLITYLSAIFIEKNRRISKAILTVCGVLVFGALVYFKYYNFIIESINSLIHFLGSDKGLSFIDVILPVGISFYIFQAFSYVIDVYKETEVAEKHFGYYALFISFFPQLVAGPIERTCNLLPQLKNKKAFDYPLAVYGLRLMLWGYFKKLIIADRLAYYADAIWNSYPEFEGFTLFLGIFFFTIQIYCDFSGYSDIAIGSANLLGIKLMTNFKSPYFSSSVKEFFTRWHISLSSWFRDYVYIPLGGNRCSKIRRIINVMITFLVSGLWHGAAWTYVAWGGIHGIGNILSGGKKSGSQNSKIGTLIWWIKVVVTFNFCMFAWTFFRAFDFKCAWSVLSRLFVGINNPVAYLTHGVSVLNIPPEETILITISIIILIVFDYVSLKRDVLLLLDEMPQVLRYITYTILIIAIVYFVPVYGNNEFIYFQF